MRHPQRKVLNVTYWRPKEMLKNAPFWTSKQPIALQQPPYTQAKKQQKTKAALPAKTA